MSESGFNCSDCGKVIDGFESSVRGRHRYPEDCVAHLKQELESMKAKMRGIANELIRNANSQERVGMGYAAMQSRDLANKILEMLI